MKIHMNLIQKIFLTFIFTLTASQVSLAHSVYFEMNEKDQVIIRFGEFGDDYEESPGYLDSLDCQGIQGIPRNHHRIPRIE